MLYHIGTPKLRSFFPKSMGYIDEYTCLTHNEIKSIDSYQQDYIRTANVHHLILFHKWMLTSNLFVGALYTLVGVADMCCNMQLDGGVKI